MGQFIHRYVFYNCYKELCGIVGLLCMKNYVYCVCEMLRFIYLLQTRMLSLRKEKLKKYVP